MRVGSVGLPELLIILLVLLLIFGARRLPEIASALGRSIREFKKGLLGEDETEKVKRTSVDSQTDNHLP
jgi:sec-independent protein translocase protein TatA